MNILVGMSGGVDSSVAALLLKKAGHDVTAVTMSIWDGPADTAVKRPACYGPDEAEDLEQVRKVCADLDIPLHIFNCADEYRSLVLSYFRDEYRAGRTPNPCVRCNHLVKFGVLLDSARRSGLGFDAFSTGHYARVGHDETSGRHYLRKSPDSSKDQSYFLYRLSQSQLSSLLLPLGDYQKSQVREIARDNGLHVADKEDSQDFYCGDYQDLLQFPAGTGNIVLTDGRIVGAHHGIWNFTVGQRRGLGISWPEPLYVVRLDAATNSVIVGSKDEVKGTSFLVTDLNWMAVEHLEAGCNVRAKIRSAHKEVEAHISPLSTTHVRVELGEPQDAITPGQSAVFYQGDILLGGGIIEGT